MPLKPNHAVSSSQDGYSKLINKEVNCNSSNVIYLVECTKCKEQYVGQAGRLFKSRMSEHVGYIILINQAIICLCSAVLLLNNVILTLEHSERIEKKNTYNYFKLNLKV